MHVAPDTPARFLKPLLERPHAGLKFRIVRSGGHEYANTPHPLALLRVRRERPRHGGGADERDELAPFHARHGCLPTPCGGSRAPQPSTHGPAGPLSEIRDLLANRLTRLSFRGEATL